MLGLTLDRDDEICIFTPQGDVITIRFKGIQSGHKARLAFEAPIYIKIWRTSILDTLTQDQRSLLLERGNEDSKKADDSAGVDPGSPGDDGGM